MAAIRFTDDDRDAQGFIKTTPLSLPAEPRSLADLLPTPASIQADARQEPKMKRDQTVMMAALIVSVVVLFLRFGVYGNVSPAGPAPIPATPQASGDVTAPPSPIPASAPAVAGRLLIAFAAPDGQPLGAIESTRAITPTAHYGSDWIQADVAGSGLVWLRVSDAPALSIVGPDLAPRRPAAVPAAVPAAAPAAPQAPAYVPPTPEPQPPCLTSGVPGKTVEVCSWGDLAAEAQAKWLATYGGNVGTVTTPTPYVECSDQGKFIMCGGATP